MQNKNILFVIDSMGIGGAEKITLTLARKFVDNGYDVDLIVCDNIVHLEIPSEINLYILDFKKSLLDYTRYRLKLHRMIDDLIKENGYDYNLILVELQKATRLMHGYNHLNLFHVVHNTLSMTAFKNRKGLRLFLKKRSLQKIYNGLNIITVSDGIKDDLLTTIGIKPQSIQTIYNPIDREHITHLALEANLVNEDNYIVHVGRFDPAKRHDILLKAFLQSNLDTKLVLVGDGSERDKIITWIDEFGLHDKVIMCGFVQNPYPIIKNAKLLLLSSVHEGFGVVLVESLMLGTPVVSTNCKSGPNEIMTGSLAEYLVPVNDIEGLSRAIQKIYHNPYVVPGSLMDRFLPETIIRSYMELMEL
ncbi:glycosyltransferase [Sulfuricurvum sp.]|uniref:glycosyltransferase n=1 Tax=Sulfuricurvum sp. TaxID=2025608 RepID=UPI002D572AB3|nr:glycosyltransferase [Sulfuricurvum sp.]HZF71585.1 glycosyltransferase [Sulfuricurvum sp.]